MDDFPKRRSPRASDSGKLGQDRFKLCTEWIDTPREDLAGNVNRQVKGADRLVIALPCAFVDQAKRGGTFGLGPEEKPALASSAGTLLTRRQKLVAFGRQHSLVDAADRPPVTGCRIFL